MQWRCVEINQYIRTHNRDLLDWLPDAMVRISENGDIIDTNELFHSLFPAYSKDVIGKSVSTILPGVDLDTLWKKIDPPAQSQSVLLLKDSGALWRLQVYLIPYATDNQCDSAYLILRDETARVEEDSQLDEIYKTLSYVENAKSDLVAVLDKDGIIEYASPTYEIMFAVNHQEVIGKNIFLFIHPEDCLFVQDRISELFEGKYYLPSVEFRYWHQNGRWVYVEVRATPIFEGDVITKIVVVARDINRRRQLEMEIKHMAYHDDLTGLPNRLSLRTELERRLDSSNENRSLALFLIDLDGFKQVNDTLGHTLGDEFLQVASDRLKQNCPKNGFLARMGGDEFIVLLSPFQNLLEINNVANEILNALAKPLVLSNQEWSTTASIGISKFPENGTTAEELIRKADIALYQVKNRGKNGYQNFDS